MLRSLHTSNLTLTKDLLRRRARMMSLGLRGSTSKRKRGRATSSGMSLRPLLLPILLLLRRNYQGGGKN
jgi:hypothetical protein